MSARISPANCEKTSGCLDCRGTSSTGSGGNGTPSHYSRDRAGWSARDSCAAKTPRGDPPGPPVTQNLSRPDSTNVAGLGENCRIDSSNSSEEFTRNRIRHQLLPLLEQGFNPRVVESLGRLADQAAEWEGSLAEIAGVFLQQVVLEQSVCGYRMRRSNWMRLPQVIQQEGLRQLWSTAGWPRQNMGAAHWERALEAIRNGGKQLFPGGVRMDVREDLVRIYFATEE